MKITFKNGKADKIHIYCDEEYALTVDGAFFACLDIRQNQEMSEDEFSALQEKINLRRAYNYCVSLLSRRDHSAKELRTKLMKKGFGEESFGAVERLIEQGYVNDERFSLMYANELLNLKGYGKMRIEQELMRKGVDRETIRLTVDSIEFENDKITEIINRKYRRYLGDEKGRQRAVNGLLRLGYGYGEIRDAIREIRDNEENSFFEVEDE